MDDNTKVGLITLGLIVMVLSVAIYWASSGGFRQARRVSHNLSLRADAFNVVRKLTVINQRTDTVLFQMTGNFSLQNEGHNELAVIGENPDGRYYKHFISLSSEISYVVEDLGGVEVSKHKYEINFNPKMILPAKPLIID